MKLMEVKTGKGYASLKLNDASGNNIKEILKDLGIKDIISDLHITVMYDESNPLISMDTNPDKEYSAKIDGVKMLGEPGTKWYAIALMLDSPSINKLHDEYIEKGFKHSYPKFLAHMSLKYDPSDDDIKIIKDNLEKIRGIDLIFSGESLKRITK